MPYLIAACAVMALFLVYLFFLEPGRLPKNADNVLWRTKYAHRGLHRKDKTVPENSLSAFSAAVEAGYGIELDINLSSDGKIVVFHDERLSRVCGIDKAITDCTYAELSQYRLCGTNEKIPLFSKVLSLVAGRVPLIIELKNTKNTKELCEKAAAFLDAYQGPYCIESFNPRIVCWFYKNRPNIVRGQLAAAPRSYGKSNSYFQKLISSSLLTNVTTRPHFVAYNHRDSHHKPQLGIYRMLGGKLVGWTVSDPRDIDYCTAYFDVIIFEYLRP